MLYSFSCLSAFVHAVLFAWNAFSPFLFWDNAYLSLKSLLNFHILPEAFSDPLGIVPLPHGSSPKFWLAPLLTTYVVPAY